MTDTGNLLHKPLYSTAEAALLVGTPTRRLRDWIKKQDAATTGRLYHILEKEYYLSYLGLVLADLWQRLLQYNVSYHEARAIISPEWLGGFLRNQKLKLEIPNHRHAPAQWVDALDTQQLDKRVFLPDFSLAAWRIAPQFANILIYPSVYFGAPYITGHFIRTRTLWNAHELAGEDIASIAWQWEIPPEKVREALDFEQFVRDRSRPVQAGETLPASPEQKTVISAQGRNTYPRQAMLAGTG